MSIASVVFTDQGGTTHSLTYNATTGAWEGTVSAGSASSYPQSGHFFPTSVTATDSYGNVNTVDTTDADFGNDLELYVKEKVAPVVTITSPTSGAYVTSSTPTLTFTVADDANQATGCSGIAAIEDNKNPLTITLDGTSYDYDELSDIFNIESVTITPITTVGSYVASASMSATFLTLADGQHTISLVAYDNDGNSSVAATSTFTVDTVAPSLTVTTPADGSQTNLAAWTVEGVTSDVTSLPVTVTVTLDGVDQGTVTVGQGGVFTKTGTYSTEGVHTFVITATDTAGKYTSITRTVDYSTTLPEFLEVTLVPNPVDAGQTYVVSVKVR